MSWKSGVHLLIELWYRLRLYVPPADRVEALVHVMKLFEDYDCDGLSAVVDPQWPESAVAYGLLYGVNEPTTDDTLNSGPQGAD